MIVGLYQTTEPASVMDGLKTIDSALAAASDADTDMLVFPEIYLPGYTTATASKPENWDQVLQQIGVMCQRHHVALTIGLPEYTPEGVYNAAYSFGDDGSLLAHHRKLQLFGPDENALYRSGDQYVTFYYKRTCFGLLICYDVEFPEHVRALARIGAEVILVPTANMMPYVNVNQITVPARANENGVTIVYANYCGSSGGLDYVGMSGIFGPDGYALAAKGTNPGLCIAELPNGWSEHGIPLSTQLNDLKEIQ